MEHEITLGQRSKRFVRDLFGISGSGQTMPRERRMPPSLHLAECTGESRVQVLDAMKAFLVENDLPLTADNVLAAHSAFTGNNLRLRRKIALHLQSGLPVTQEWLESQAEDDRQDSDVADQIDQMADLLDSSVSDFQLTAIRARTAVSDYGRSIEESVSEIGVAGDPGSQTLAGWLEISQRMIAQSLQFEERLRRSETEAQKLRYELEKVRRLADIDHMTGLPNRRGFDSLLEEELRKANENIEPLSVAFCDIDNFKRVNDTWGHDTGDRVISSVARSLAKLTDDKCHAARHGGEEFVMLFRGISLDEAFLRLNEAREALSQRRFVKEASDEVIGAVTFSGGIADVFAYESPRFALRAADEALYRAKHAGRNRICLAER
ncbi:MAG: GGDEF domain-containing protein [Novosphingobium sp.]|nr:GGDEF domain-containing protein [Novosphingobium sp.]